MSARDGRAEDLKHAIRATVKEAVWLTTRHRPGEKNDVALFATRRGGSTWLMQVIAAAPGFRSLDQPFSVMTANLTPGHYRRIPKYAYGVLVSPPPEEFDALRTYTTTLLDGDLPVNAPYRFWRRDFRWRTDRQVLKIVGAKNLMPWLDDEFDLDVVYLLRHPIAQAMSCVRNNWTLTVRAFLDNQRFVESHLSSSAEARCHDVLRTGSRLDQFVLNWGLENLVPLRAMTERPDWNVVSYEAIVLRPDEVVETLAEALDLGSPSDLTRDVRNPSRSSRMTTASRREAMLAGDAPTLLRQPLAEIELEERRHAMSILDILGVGVYRADEIEPVLQR